MTKTDEKWAERIRRWQESGKTAEEFTAGQPYKASTLKWRAADLRKRAKGGRGYSTPKALSERIRMVRVVPGGRAAASNPGTANGLVVEVSGARIAVTRGFDAELLADVLGVLARGGAR